MTIAHEWKMPSLEDQGAALLADILAIEARQGKELLPKYKLLYGLYLDWKRTDPRKLTERQGLKFDGFVSAFAKWLGWDSGHLYQALRCGLALWGLAGPGVADQNIVDIIATGRLDDVAVLGKALDSGWTPERIKLTLAESGLPGLRAALSGAEGDAGESRRAARDAAHEALTAADPNLPRAPRELDTLAYQVIGLLPASIREAAILATQTGESLEDAARTVVKQMMDPRRYLSAQLCAVPGCGEPSAELHHLKLQGQRFRSNEVLLPLCRRHHQATPSLESEAAHAAHQHDWIARFWPDEATFWEERAAQYAGWMEGER